MGDGEGPGGEDCSAALVPAVVARYPLRMSDRDATTAPLPIAVLLSGTGRTLVNLLEQIERGDLPVRVRCVIGSKPGLRGLEIAEAAGVRTHIVRRRDFPDT